MFENWVTNLKNSLSADNFKMKTSETLDNIKTSIRDKSTLISGYFQENQPLKAPPKTISTPELNNKTKLYWPTLVDNRTVWVDYGDYQAENDNVDHQDVDVVDRFCRIITISDNENNRRNDREEIRRRLATGCDTDEFYGSDKPGKKPSLQARLQSGMNLQICFMNETSSDTESPSSESCPSTPQQVEKNQIPPKPKANPEPPKTLNLTNKNNVREVKSGGPVAPTSGAGIEGDFFTRQARLQAEARLALSQAKDRARLQMEADRLSGKVSPITEMLRASLKKVGIRFPEDRRRVSRQMLTDMNVAQLQVIVNDLHTQIESLNEGLVKFLMERDELHMSQDSMLVDIEDVTRYLGAKESCLKEDIVKNNNLVPPQAINKPVITRIVSLGKK